MYLSQIHIYPVKSLRGLNVASGVVEPRGFRHDRRWMVVDAEGQFLTQRTHPVMTQIAVALYSNGLTISTPGHPPLDVDRPGPAAPTHQVVIWKDTVEALDAGEEAADWFSAVLGRACRLVHMPDTSVRPVDPVYAPRPGLPVSFADGYPYLLHTTASLADLNTRLEVAVPMSRFRPNLVVEGAEEAYEEDYWREIQIGDVRFAVVKPSARCVITTTDQETGARGKEPLRTLATYRKVNSNVNYGQNLIPQNEGVLTQGMPVEVLSWR